MGNLQGKVIHMRRSENLKLRMTPEEMNHLRTWADAREGFEFREGKRKGEKNYSGFFRAQLLAATNYKNEELKQRQRQLAYEVRKIGVNVNQIAKKINSGFGTRKDLAVLTGHLEKIEQLFLEHKEACERAWESQS